MSTFLNRSDGISADEALARADLHLASIRTLIDNGVEDSVSAIGTLFADDDAMDIESRRQELHKLSDGILSVAGLYDKEALGKIAFSLCDLLEILKSHNAWDMAAIRLHYDAMRVVQSTNNLGKEAQDALVNGLAEVVRSISTRQFDVGASMGAQE